MPSGKDRSKEDTWKAADLKKALKDDKTKSKDESRRSKEHSSRKSEDRRERKDKDDDRKRRGHDDVANGESDRRRSDRDREKERDKDRGRDRDREKDKERGRERDREKGKGGEKDRDREREKDRERRRRDEVKERPREKEREQDRAKRREKEGSERSKDAERSKERTLDVEKSKDRDKSRERRKEKESGDKERDRDRRREKDDGREGKERNGERDRSRDRRKEKSGEDRDRERRRDKEGDRRERSKERDTSRERRKEREREDRDRGKEKTKDRDRDKERERRREKDRERLDKENKDSDKDERRRNERRDKEKQDSDRRRERTKNEDGLRERSRERRERKDNGDREKGKSEKSIDRDKEERVKRREKELMESLKKEEQSKKNALRFRSDTVEEADTIDEDVEQRRKASLRRMSSTAAAEEIHDEENGAYDYDDDDFEDYDDDFEDDEGDDEEASLDVQDHSGMQDLLQAINAENQDARAASREGREESRDSSESSTKEKVRPTTASRGRINFVAAKQKQITDKVASRTRKRGQELMHLIDLDVAVFDIFDLPPLNEYELYIKNFGRSDTKQAYVQCNEDNLEKEIQTEEIETRTKWTQNPASDAAGFGDDEDDLQEDLTSLTEKANIDSLRLSKFLQRATQTCLILLEENISEQANTQFKERKDMTCSDGSIQLSTKHPYLEGRPVKYVHMSPVQTHFLLVAYGQVKERGKATSNITDNIQEKGLVCFWNTNEPSGPQKVLICESTPRCCCLSPSKATLAFAGLEDGSLVAWDLRESSTMHSFSKISVGDREIILRPPTFSTAGVLKKDESHLSPVVSILPVVMPGDSVRASGGSNLMSDDVLGLSFQLASLEENAAIHFWVVVELDRANNAGSESDLGLSPGGKIKLIKSSSISLESPFRDFKMSLQALIMRFLPHDPNHIYIGTDGGYVLHCERHGSRAPPKAHRPDIGSLVSITAVDLSPWQLPCMLAGSEDGNLWLFNLKNEIPLLSWSSSTGGSAVLSVQWSRSKPSVFYVLDSNSILYVWDLLKSDQGPVAVEKFKHGRVVCFELSNDYTASGIGIPGRNPELVLVYESGAVEVHKLSRAFSSASGDELDTFASFLDKVI